MSYLIFEVIVITIIVALYYICAKTDYDIVVTSTAIIGISVIGFCHIICLLTMI